MSRKSRKQAAAKPGPAAPAPKAAPTPVAPSPPAAPVEHSFYFLPDVPAEPVDERELHELMKDWRHGRATRTIGSALQDAYVTIFSVLMIGAMVVNLVLKMQTNASSCATATCLTARTLLPWSVATALFALALGLSRLFGPVLASAAEGFWLMDAPISRSRLLRGRLVLAVVAALAVGGVLSGLTAALSGSSALAVGLWAAGGAFGAAGLVAFAAGQQGIERHRLVRAGQLVFGALSLASVLLVVAISSGLVPLTFPAGADETLAGAVAAVAVLGLVAALAVARRRLDGIRRSRLVSGGSLISGMQGAMFALDFGLVRDILVERDAVRRGHVRPTAGRGTGLNALVWRDLQRIVRFPRALVGLVLTVVAPYAVDALGLATLNPMISGLLLVVGLVPFLGTLRVLTRTGGLARNFPFKTSAIRQAAMLIPAVLAVLWALATLPAFVGIVSSGAERSIPDALAVALVTALAGWLGAVRWVTAKKVDFNTPMVATETGAIPPTLIFNLLRGFDMVVLVTAPVMLGGSPMWSLGIGTVAFMGLRGTFNMDELKQEQEKAQKEAAAAKALREGRATGKPGAPKTKVPKPSGR